MSQWDADGLYIYNTNEAVTISGGVATVTKGRVVLTSEAGVTDSLDSISLNYGAGIPSRGWLIFLSAAATHTITININGSNIKSGGSASSVVLTGNTVYVGMVYNNVLTLLNADFPSSAVDWTRPGAIGSVTPNTGAFTTLAASGDFAIATNKFTVASASGNTLVAGTLSVTGDVAVNTNKFTVTASSGNTVVAGTLGVTLGATFSSTVSAIADVTDLYRITMSQTISTNTAMDVSAVVTSNSGTLRYLANFTGTVTGTAAAPVAFRIVPIITPTGGSTTQSRGLSVNPTLTGSQNVSTMFAGIVAGHTVGISAGATYSGTATASADIWLLAPVVNSGTVTTKHGIYADAFGASDYVWYSQAGLFRIGGDFIHDTGDLYWTTAGAGLAYGEIYQQANASATTISVQNTWYQVVNMSAGVSNLTTPSAANDNIVVTKAGIYKITCVATVQGTATKSYELSVAQNGTPSTKLYTAYYAVDANSRAVAITGILSCAASDTLDLRIRCTDATTGNATIVNANLNCTMIGA